MLLISKKIQTSASNSLTTISYIGVLIIIALVLFSLGNTTELLIQKYMGDDSFFYLVIAKNISQSGFSSFDGIHFSNGYHPLWQLLVSGMALIVQDDMVFLLATISLGITLSIVSLVIVYLLLRNFKLSPEWVATSILFGVFFIFLPSWYGLESFLATALFLASLYYYFNHYRGTHISSQLLLGLFLSLTVLARLDAIFLIIFFFISRFIQIDKRDGQEIISFLFLGGFFSIPILSYLGFNYFHTGHFMPISGALKSSFPDVTLTNLPLEPAYLIRIAPPVMSSFLVVTILSYGYLARRQWGSPFLTDVYFINLGVLFFSCYEFFFQQDAMWGLRPWHFALPNIVMVLSLGPCVFRYLPVKLPMLIIPALLIFNFVALNQKFLTSTPENPIKSDLFATAMWIREHTQSDDIIAVTDPGIIAFFGNRKTISLDGLANNYRYQDILNEENLETYLNDNRVNYIGIFARGHDANLSVNRIEIESRLFDSHDTLVLLRENWVYSSPNGFYSLWSR
jgi:hypothetical protein